MSASPTALFWIAAVVAIFPLTLIFVPIINLAGGIIAMIAAVVILFTDSVVPNSYVWGGILIFFISTLPPAREAGKSLAIALAGPDPNGRDVNIGDAIVGSAIGIWYNSGWLEFSSKNNGTWLIYLNWFLASIGLWTFLGFVFLKKLGNSDR